MNIKVSRRHFLKLLAATTALSACTPVSDQLADLLEPQVRPPEEALPGQATWYASTCRMCPAGCGIVVRNVNGRAKKIEGNPNHPLNQGKLCARGQAGLQELYHPDRLRNAVRQSGGRGSRQFEPIYWDEALATLLEKLQNARPSQIAFLGNMMPDHLYLLASRLLEGIGASPPILFDLETALHGRAVSMQLSKKLFGSEQMPVYDVANADVVYSFGANFIETWDSPTAYGHAYGNFRQGQTRGRGFFVQFEPRLSSTAAVADEWVAIRPGTEGLVALALGRIMVEQGLAGAFGRAHAGLYERVQVGPLAEASDVSVEKLQNLAEVFAEASRPLAIPGGGPAGQSNGFESFLAIHSLNMIMRRLGLPGGVYLTQEPPVETLPAAPAPHSFADMRQLIGKMAGGEIELLMVHGANPVHELPAAAGFKEALQQVPFVVSFSPFVNETAVQSDLILPDHTYLESWGYQIVVPGADRPAVSGQQPVVNPLYDTRSTASVILALAAEMGGDVSQSLPWADEILFLEDSSGALFGSSLSAFQARTPGDFWVTWQQHGGWWADRELKQEPTQIDFNTLSPLPVAGATFAGDPNQYPYHLHPYQTTGLGDGRSAHLPWLQELPETMTTARWQTWIELNPLLAGHFGLENNDLVRVISPHGQIEAVVVIFPGIRPEVVGMPLGRGHTDYGRYAAGRGSNPMDLIAAHTDDDTGALAWGATRVRIEPLERTYKLARMESLDGEGRENIR